MKGILFSMVYISLISAGFTKAANISACVPVNVSDKDVQLIQAAKDGNLPVVQALLEKGDNVNADDGHGITALMVASWNGHTEIVKSLLEKGADVNIKKTDSGVTPLFIASLQGHTEVVKLLLAAKADVNVKVSREGKIYTPLSIAKQWERNDIVSILEKAGAKE